jgi:hypothetical protein
LCFKKKIKEKRGGHLCNGTEEQGEVLRASADFIFAVHRARWLGR